MHERRARIQGNEWEVFDPIEVYERDGWVCGICDEPVDRAAPFPEPLSVSLDHVKPVSLGGSHTRDNTRCAHLRCNSKRGNRATV
jgi:5-methylcytosine-specific restriction endonuclease McrA